MCIPTRKFENYDRDKYRVNSVFFSLSNVFLSNAAVIHLKAKVLVDTDVFRFHI